MSTAKIISYLSCTIPVPGTSSKNWPYRVPVHIDIPIYVAVHTGSTTAVDENRTEGQTIAWILLLLVVAVPGSKAMTMDIFIGSGL